MVTKENRSLCRNEIDAICLLVTGKSMIFKLTEAKYTGGDPFAVEAISPPESECGNQGKEGNLHRWTFPPLAILQRVRPRV